MADSASRAARWIAVVKDLRHLLDWMFALFRPDLAGESAASENGAPVTVASPKSIYDIDRRHIFLRHVIQKATTESERLASSAAAPVQPDHVSDEFQNDATVKELLDLLDVTLDLFHPGLAGDHTTIELIQTPGDNAKRRAFLRQVIKQAAVELSGTDSGTTSPTTIAALKD